MTKALIAIIPVVLLILACAWGFARLVPKQSMHRLRAQAAELTEDCDEQQRLINTIEDIASINQNTDSGYELILANIRKWRKLREERD